MMGRRVWTSEEMEAQRGACSHLHWTPVSRKPGYNQLCAHHPGPQEKQDSLPQVSVYIPRPAPGGPTPPHPQTSQNGGGIEGKSLKMPQGAMVGETGPRQLCQQRKGVWIG